MSIKNNKFKRLVADIQKNYRNLSNATRLNSIQNSNLVQSPIIKKRADKRLLKMPILELINTVFRVHGSKQVKNMTNDLNSKEKVNKTLEIPPKFDEKIHNKKKDNNELEEQNTKIPERKTFFHDKSRKSLERKYTNAIKIVNIQDYLGINMFKNNTDMKLVSNEPILAGFCVAIYPPFALLSNENQSIFIKDMKQEMSIDLDKKDLYNKFNYKHSRFKKSDFQLDLINNNPLNSDHFYIYLGDYFNLNFIINKDGVYKFLNKYQTNRHTFLIFDIKNDIYMHYNCDGLSICTDSELTKLDGFIVNSDNDSLIKLKLPELQNIAKSKGINIKKDGKSSLINKKKNELIKEIVESV